jgi:hypothetical protein
MGVTNSYNLHVWTEAITEMRHQRQDINVWTIIIGSYLLSPFVLLPLLNGQHYYTFLLDDLPQI